MGISEKTYDIPFDKKVIVISFKKKQLCVKNNPETFDPDQSV